MFYNEYTLTAKGPLNAKASEVCRKGALIKTEEGGYGCIHPWPELGDACLEDELEALRKGKPLALGTRALYCAKIDGHARAAGKNLFDGLYIPRSHATLPSCVSPATIRIMEMKGFKAGKIKADPHLEVTTERLTILASMVPSWRWRLDFNSSLNENESLGFWKSLPHDLKSRIDFVEDPCPFSVSGWERLVDAGIPLALDIGIGEKEHCSIPSDLPLIRIVKPAREKTPENLNEPPVFTTVMDHPLGQLWAMYQAAEYYRNALPSEIPYCGLCTHLLFEPTAFTEQMGGMTPQATPPTGTGLGFDDLLKDLEWSEL